MSSEAADNTSQVGLGAIVLANGAADSLAAHLNVPHKALIDIEGLPMVNRVVAALQACPAVSQAVVACRAGGPVATALRGQVALAEAAEPSILGGIQAGFERLPQISQAIMVTCDMPLLTPEAVAAFARMVLATPDTDLVYAMVRIELTRERFPETHRTTVKLRDGSYTAAGLSALSRHFIEFCGPNLMAAFQARKSKIAMGRLLGAGFLLRFALGLLSVNDIVKRAEEIMNCRARAVELPYPECGFDVDTEADLAAARQALRRQARDKDEG